MSTDSAARVLELGADLIDTHGWIKGLPGNPDAGFCADGACSWASRHSDEPLDYQAYLDAVNRLRQAVGGAVTSWNDYGATCQEEVVGTMRGVAKSLRSYNVEPQEDADADSA